MEKSGIYKIVNIENGKFYIGSSKDLNGRWIQHKSGLKNKKHINIILQRAWDKYGKDKFTFQIVEECDKSILLEREQFYIDTLNPEYNIGLKSSGGDNLTNHPDRKEIIEKIVKGLYKKYENMTDDERKHLSEIRLGEKNSNYGNNWTEEMKEKSSKRTTEFFKNHTHYKTGKTHEEIFGERAKEINKKLSISASLKTGDKNPFFGKHHSEKTKKEISDIRKGKYYGKQNIPFIIDGKEYTSLGEASKELGIRFTTIRWRLKSKNKKFENYKYKE